MENDTEMVDHSMNPEFSGASYDSCDFLIKARFFFFYIFTAFKFNHLSSLFIVLFCDLTKEHNIYTIGLFEDF